MRREVGVLAVCLEVTCALRAAGQCDPQLLHAADGAAGDSFGRSVAISNEVTIVGAPGDDDNGPGSGAAYVFRYDRSWTQEAKLIPADGAPGDVFGNPVALDGAVAVVGADWAHIAPSVGSAYVFRHDGSLWSEEARLIPSGETAPGRFGESVAVWGDLIIVGAPDSDQNGPLAGSACVFRRIGSAWVEEAVLLASDGAEGDRFGSAVDISGSVAVVGAYLEEQASYWWEGGSAYVFRHDGSRWSEEAKLVPLDPAAGRHFGRSIALDSDLVIVGAPTNLGSAPGPAAYIFRYDGAAWIQEAKLLPSGGPGWFGRSVALSGETVAVGAPLAEECCGYRSGSVCAYRHEGSAWVEQSRLCASGGAPEDLFGDSVAISGDSIAVGMPFSDDIAAGAGAACVFQSPDCPERPDCEVAAFTDREAWFKATGKFATIHFNEIQGYVTDEYAAVGVVFDGSAWAGCVFGCVTPTDGCGLDGPSDIHLQFSSPMMWIAVDALGSVQFALYNGDDLVYTSPEFYGSYPGFAGLLLLEPFDAAIIADPDSNSILIDDLHFGPAPATPGPSIDDCNANGYMDGCDIVEQASFDCNENGTPDECEPPPCPGDVVPDCSVDQGDLSAVIEAWGAADAEADANGDGSVDVQDLIEVITHWGSCGPGLAAAD